MRPPREDSGKLLNRYSDYLRLLARVQIGPLLRSKLDPADAAQETLLLAYQKLHQYRGKTDAELGGWLRQILAGYLAQAQRGYGRQKRNVALEQSLEIALAESSSRLEALLGGERLSPSILADRQEQALRLASALAQLPEDQRVAVEMKHIRECKVAEIAAQLKRSQASVAGLIRRGLESLRKLLAESQ
jgi:RNA polymerase sigma-70 factor (ECF subfamily)